MTADSDDRPPPSPADIAYVGRRVQQCREILAAGVEMLRPRWHPWPRRRPTPAERARNAASFACWTPPARRISWVELLRKPALARLNFPVPGGLPCDNWPPNPAEMRKFEAYVGELIDRQEHAPVEIEVAA